ncbi:unnamed protein product [Caenorhabditis auriculariae]|uniref:Uncharacterized protein n=1 Tax=Caenorhabditis auriculariae TaxID=2777116 RepID=A0A8S1HFV7_9PELO|nr:unnamed protein product [Caenorhabditis auriculariae]
MERYPYAKEPRRSMTLPREPPSLFAPKLSLLDDQPAVVAEEEKEKLNDVDHLLLQATYRRSGDPNSRHANANSRMKTFDD